MSAGADPKAIADGTGTGTVVWLRHGHSTLALHLLQPGDGRALLVLHGLGEHAQVAHERLVPGGVADWPGPVWGLDFTGHGASSVPRGGGYTVEMLLGDADAALHHLGDVTVVGRGLGGYVGLMLAGARPQSVLGAVIADGPGLTGGGSQPASPVVAIPRTDLGAVPDPFALVELGRDIRPGDYAVNFVRFAFDASAVPDPIIVSATVRPPWLAEVAAEQGVVEATVAEALELYSRV